MKRVILLSLVILLCFSFDDLNSQDISIHTHNHIHIQGTSHAHEHIHMENSSKLFYKDESFYHLQSFSTNTYIEISQIISNPIINNIFKPPII